MTDWYKSWYTPILSMVDIDDVNNNQWASYQMRKIAGCACAGNAGNVFPATDFKGIR